MTRHFSDAPVDHALVERLLGEALRAPSAGSSRGVDLVLVSSPEQLARFHALTTEHGWRNRVAGGVLMAPVVVVPTADPSRYLERYAHPDKMDSGLSGLSMYEWPVPYWQLDAAFVTMQLLLLAEDAGLGALFHRFHRDPSGWLASIGAQPWIIAIGAVALGYPADTPAPTPTPPPVAVDVSPPAPASPDGRRTVDERIHHGLW